MIRHIADSLTFLRDILSALNFDKSSKRYINPSDYHLDNHIDDSIGSFIQMEESQKIAEYDSQQAKKRKDRYKQCHADNLADPTHCSSS